LHTKTHATKIYLIVDLITAIADVAALDSEDLGSIVANHLETVKQLDGGAGAGIVEHSNLQRAVDTLGDDRHSRTAPF
jgi:hypothetical protein